MKISNCRIKEVYDSRYGVRFYPQMKLFWFWVNVFGDDIPYWDGGFDDYESANYELCKAIKEPIYHEVNCDCEETE